MGLILQRGKGVDEEFALQIARAVQITKDRDEQSDNEYSNKYAEHETGGGGARELDPEIGEVEQKISCCHDCCGAENQFRIPILAPRVDCRKHIAQNEDPAECKGTVALIGADALVELHPERYLCREEKHESAGKETQDQYRVEFQKEIAIDIRGVLPHLFTNRINLFRF